MKTKKHTALSSLLFSLLFLSITSFAFSQVSLPYTEGFESGFIDGDSLNGQNNLTEENVSGTSFWTANTSQTNYKRAPRTGSWNAFLGTGTDQWLFIPVDLVAGDYYSVELYAIQRKSNINNASISIAFGTAANSDSMTTVYSQGISRNYEQVEASFTVPNTRTYYIGIKGSISTDSEYLSIDDIHINKSSCLTPTNPRALFPSDTSAMLRWDNVPNATYKVLWKEAGASNFSPPEFRAADVNFFRLDGLTPNTKYVFLVRSNCSSGWSDASIGRFQTLNNACDIPINLSIGFLDHEKVKLVWDTVDGSNKYRLRYRSIGSSSWISVVSSGQRGFKWISGLNASTDYEWQVKSVCEVGTEVSGTRWSVSNFFTTDSNSQLRIKSLLQPVETKLDFSLYPNPNQGQVNIDYFSNIQSEDLRIMIIDLMGQLVFDNTYPLSLGQQKLEIRLENLKSGVYYIQMTSQSGSRTEKIQIVK